MSNLTPPGPPPGQGPAAGAGPAYPPPALSYPLPHVEAPADPRKVEQLLVSLAVIVGWFVLAAVIGAVVWEKVTTLPHYTRIATTGTMDEEQLSHQFSISGWFLVIAVIGGLVSGIALTVLRRKDPIATVLLIAAGSAVATWVMLQTGLALGPGDPNTALAKAKLGAQVPVQLKPDVNAVYYVWTIAALFGSIVSLWILETASNSRSQNRADRSPAGAPYAG